MFRAVLVVMFGLAGCQIIINHNTFEPETADGPAVDGPSDSFVIPSNVLRSTAPAGVRLVTAHLDPAGTVTADGGWLTATPSVDGDKLRYALTFSGFTGPPTCACSTIGPNNHGCDFKNVLTGSATLTVFDVVSSLVSRSVDVMCIGPAADTMAGLATSTRTETMQLGTLRYDRTTVASPVVTEDGAWVGAATPGNPPFSLPIDDGVFSTAPHCVCQMTYDGNPGGTASNCKFEDTTSITTLALSETANSGPGNPIAHDAACLGTATVQVGPFITSTKPGGMIVASATIDGSGNNVLRQDGAWIRPAPDGVSGSPTNVVTYEASVFSSAPRCFCASLDTEGVACHVGSAPNVTDFTVHLTSTLPTIPNTTQVESNFMLICIGPKA